jgi:hypothetical protein
VAALGAALALAAGLAVAAFRGRGGTQGHAAAAPGPDGPADGDEQGARELEAELQEMIAEERARAANVLDGEATLTRR